MRLRCQYNVKITVCMRPMQGDTGIIIRIHGHRSLYDFVLLPTMTNFEKSQAVDTLQVDRKIPVEASHANREDNARF